MKSNHGESSISIDDYLITLTIKGVFNQEGVRSLTNELRSIIEKFNGKGFKLLVNYLDSEGGTPEAYEEVNSFIHWLNSQNIIAKAVVYESFVLADIFESRTPARKEQYFKTFNNMPEAEEWIKSQI